MKGGVSRGMGGGRGGRERDGRVVEGAELRCGGAGGREEWREDGCERR